MYTRIYSETKEKEGKVDIKAVLYSVLPISSFPPFCFVLFHLQHSSLSIGYQAVSHCPCALWMPLWMCGYTYVNTYVLIAKFTGEAKMGSIQGAHAHSSDANNLVFAEL